MRDFLKQRFDGRHSLNHSRDAKGSVEHEMDQTRADLLGIYH